MMTRPDECYLLVIRADLYNEKNMYEKALADCNHVLLLQPNHAEALYQRGLAFQGLGLWEKAHHDFRKATQLDPDFEEAQNALLDLIIKM